MSKKQDNISKAKELNKEFDWNPIPSKYKKKKSKHYSGDHVSEISPGDEQPVKKFKEWVGKYWRKKRHRHNKYEPGYGD